jgi:sialic acid synthase SpsE
VPEPLEIAGRRVAIGEPLFVIAEIGLNHGGSLDRALRLVDAAAAAGASAVKLQILSARELVAADCPAPAHVDARSLRAFFAGFELDESDYSTIAGRVREHGLALMATPFSCAAVELLERIGIDAYKIASGDLTYHGLIDRCARTGKPLVLSTGMSTTQEIADALWCARAAGGRRLALLHCVSSYPVPRGSENLRAIATLSSAFQRPIGLSDHCTVPFVLPAAIALGAVLYERHLVLEGDSGAVDHAVSSTSAELAGLVSLARDTVLALGDGHKTCLDAERPNLVPSRRSLRATRRLPAGHRIRAEDIVAVRPAGGLSPVYEGSLIGVELKRELAADAPFLPSDLPRLRGDREAA